MAAAQSAGILLYRVDPELEVLLGHPGGPFWARKDAGAWSIPKGEYTASESALDAAYREFLEELGVPVPAGSPQPLGEVKQPGGKTVTAWAVRGDLDVAAVVPGTFSMEWPPRSGRTASFPEVDRVAWFALEQAREKLLRGQLPFLDRLAEIVGT